MFEWFKNKPAQDRLSDPIEFDVGHIDITIELHDGDQHVISYNGRLFDEPEAWIIDADHYFRKWQSLAGERGMVYVGHDTYIPLANVRKVSVKRSSHVVTKQR